MRDIKTFYPYFDLVKNIYSCSYKSSFSILNALKSISHILASIQDELNDNDTLYIYRGKLYFHIL